MKKINLKYIAMSCYPYDVNIVCNIISLGESRKLLIVVMLIML